MYDTSSVLPAGHDNVKCPSKSLTVPSEVPATLMLTPVKGSLLVSVTVPVTEMS